MKEKLYIATSTSNFNNILSTESISPAGFYSRRNFGYRNFKKVGPNACDGCIVLYDQIPKFAVENKDIDDYPLVIELSRYSDIVNCADLKLHSEIDTDMGKVNCFTTTQSIYLTPENTKFIFRNNIEMRLTLTNTDRALECKFVPFYREHCVVNEPQTGFSWIPFDIVEQAIDEDAGISHKMGRRFLRRGTCTFSSSGTAIYGVSLIHNQLGLDALVDCFKN